jgi:hypothetical protein
MSVQKFLDVAAKTESPSVRLAKLAEGLRTSKFSLNSRLIPLEFGVAPGPSRQPGRIGLCEEGHEEVRSKFRFESPPRQSGIHSASFRR